MEQEFFTHEEAVKRSQKIVIAKKVNGVPAGSRGRTIHHMQDINGVIREGVLVLWDSPMIPYGNTVILSPEKYREKLEEAP